MSIVYTGHEAPHETAGLLHSVMSDAKVAGLTLHVLDIRTAARVTLPNGRTVFVQPQISAQQVDTWMIEYNHEAIAELRAAGGWSVAELAAEVGVKDQTIYRWEKGEATPRANSLGIMKGLACTLVEDGQPYSFATFWDYTHGEKWPFGVVKSVSMKDVASGHAADLNLCDYEAVARFLWVS